VGNCVRGRPLVYRRKLDALRRVPLRHGIEAAQISKLPIEGFGGGFLLTCGECKFRLSVTPFAFA
jgi:hypothetical protein